MDGIDHPARMCERTVKGSELCDVGFAVGVQVAIAFVGSAEGAFFAAKSMVRPRQQNAFGELRCISRRRGGWGLRGTLFDEGRIEGGTRRDDGCAVRRG